MKFVNFLKKYWLSALCVIFAVWNLFSLSAWNRDAVNAILAGMMLTSAAYSFVIRPRR